MSTKKITAQLTQIPVQLAAADGEQQGPPKFTAHPAYSGGVVSRSTTKPPLAHDYIFDLSGMKPSRTVKANLDHKPEQRVGHVEDVQNDGKQLLLTGSLSAATQHSEQVAKSAANGYQWEVSIEANMSKGGMSLLAAGKTAVVNGKTVTGPLFIVQKSQLTGIAFCSQGADEGNLVSIAASAAGDPEMTEFDTFVVSCGADPETITDENRAKLQMAFDAIQKSGAVEKPYRSFSTMVEAEEKEQKRREEIEKIGVELMRNNRPFIDQIRDMVNHAIESGMTPTEFELQALRNQRLNSGVFRVVGGAKKTDPQLIECALAMAAGLPDIEKHYRPELLEAVDRNGMRTFSLQELLMETAVANGYQARAGQRITRGNIRAVLEHCFPPGGSVARLSGFTTVSLPNILGNIANKEALQGYMEEDQTWREIASVKSVTNFYQHTHVRLLANLEYEELGPTGEIKHGTVGEETYTTQAKTYAKMLGLTREAIINDDAGAFDDVREILGRGGAQKFNNTFWANFMSALATTFTTARTNYLAGATTNLGTDGVGLGLGVLTYRKMRSPTADGSKRVGASVSSPSILLAPPELETIARQFWISAGNAAVMANGNIYQGLYRPVIQNRLSDTAFTGNSTTAWYLFGTTQKAMVASFLNGQQTPIVESTDADFNQLGILFRGVFDFGCDTGDYLAGVMLKGAA